MQYAIRGGDEAGLAGRGGGVSQTVGVSMTALYIFSGVLAFLTVSLFGGLALLNAMWREIDAATGTGD